MLERDEEVAEFLYLKDLNQQPTYRLYKMIEEEDEDEDDNDEDDSVLWLNKII